MTKTSVTDSNPKPANATCPTGKRLIGTGAEITGGEGQVLLDDLIPNTALTNVRAAAVEDENGTTADWSITAYATCFSQIRRSAKTSGMDSAPIKQTSATCPVGRQTIGGGGDINSSLGADATGEVAVQRVLPDSTGRSVIARAVEDEDGYADNWSITAYAICAVPPADMERVVAVSASNSSSPRSITATCPAGKFLFAMYGDTMGADGQLVLNNVTPNGALTSATAVAWEDENGTGLDWKVRAHAICGPHPGTGGLELAGNASAADSSSSKTVTASCGADAVMGAGADITEGFGQVRIEDIAVDLNLTTVTARAVEDQTGTTTNWTLRAWAICASMPRNIERVAATTPSDSAFTKDANVTCPAGKGVLANGADIVDGAGQVVLDALTMGTPVVATAFEDETGKDTSWSLSAFAICGNHPDVFVIGQGTGSDSLSPKSIGTACAPFAAHATGGGGDIVGGGGQVSLTGLRGSLGDFTATAYEDENGTEADWSLGSAGFCMR